MSTPTADLAYLSAALKAPRIKAGRSQLTNATVILRARAIS